MEPPELHQGVEVPWVLVSNRQLPRRRKKLRWDSAHGCLTPSLRLCLLWARLGSLIIRELAEL